AADIELIWMLGTATRGQISARPGIEGIRSRVGIQHSLLSQLACTVTFQQRFDAGRRLASQMLGSSWQQNAVPQKPQQVADAREKIILKRRSPVTFTSPPIGTVTPALKLTKTIQNLYDLDEDDNVAALVPMKQMKFAATGSFVHHMTGLSSSKLSMSMALPLTKVVQNDAYMAPVLLSSVRTKALTNMSRNLVNKEEPPKELPPGEPVLSPLEGTKIICTLESRRRTLLRFSVCVEPQAAEVVFVKKDDAVTAYKKYNNRCLDGQPMKCNLHMNGNLLLRLSDSPSVKESELPRRGNAASSFNPPAEMDPDTILKALFKSSGASVTTQPTEFKIKL
uniref:POLDIP3 n=1 Tax=Cricetulus griseus TaxID=10029 RepID=A0A8C2QE37_CRIGR